MIIQNNTVVYYNWEDINNLTRKLIEIIIKDNFKPDLIIGVLRGGCVPAVCVAHQLNLRELFTISASTTIFEKIRSERKEPELSNLNGLPTLSDRTIMVVDDVTNTGKTLTTIREHLVPLNPKNLKLAALVWDTVLPLNNEVENSCVADYYSDIIHAWAHFPWEK
jgi:uncharacterized protein